MSDFQKECDERCKNLNDKLRNFYDGVLFEYEGNYYPLYDYDEEFWKQDGYAYKENEDGDMTYFIDGDELPENDVEVVTLEQYLNKDDTILDEEYVVDSNLRYNSVILCYETGGPGVYINTYTRKIELYWSSTQAFCGLDYDVRVAIDEMYSEYYNSMR